MLRAGIYPGLLDEAYGWGIEDMWNYAFYALVAYARAASERTGRSLEEIASSLAERQGITFRRGSPNRQPRRRPRRRRRDGRSSPAAGHRGRGPRISVARGDLDITQRYAGIERRHERPTQHVGVDVAEPGLLADGTHPAVRRALVQP